MKPSNGWGAPAPSGSELALVLGVFPLTATTLAVLLAVAALPTLVLQPDPQRRHDAAVDQVATAAASEVLAVARTAGDTWILNGVPLAASGLARLLRSRPQGVGAVRFLPSEALTSAEVAASLAWLRSHTALPVLLDPLTPAP